VANAPRLEFHQLRPRGTALVTVFDRRIERRDLSIFRSEREMASTKKVGNVAHVSLVSLPGPRTRPEKRCVPRLPSDHDVAVVVDACRRTGKILYRFGAADTGFFAEGNDTTPPASMLPVPSAVEQSASPWWLKG